MASKAEKRKRMGILSLLCTKRMNQPEQPALTIVELEQLLGCPREHLEMSLWYLRESGTHSARRQRPICFDRQGV